MNRLEYLDLTGSKITGKGLAALKNLTQLKTLELDFTQADDLALETIAGFPNLESLSLYRTNVTNAGLIHLKGLKQLISLDVGFTAVTPQAVKDFRKANPKVSITN